MNTKSKHTLYLTQAGLIAAAYLSLTSLSSVFGLAYGAVQFRFSEALTILPIFTPAAIPALTVGCFLSNLASPLGIIDIFFGTLASLLSALASRYLAKFYKIKGVPILSFLPPIIFNALIIGAELTFLSAPPTMKAFCFHALTIGGGQAVVCVGLGLPLAVALNKTGLFSKTKSF